MDSKTYVRNTKMKAFKEYKTYNNSNSLTRGNHYDIYSRKSQSFKETKVNPAAYYKLMVSYPFVRGGGRGNFF